MAQDGTVAYVADLPRCDFTGTHMQCSSNPRRFDGATRMGPWANMCLVHFSAYGRGLGLGVGQELKVREPQPSPVAMSIAEMDEAWFAQASDDDRQAWALAQEGTPLVTGQIILIDSALERCMSRHPAGKGI